MTKKMLLGLAGAALIGTGTFSTAHAQTPAPPPLYNKISGKVWRDWTPNGVRNTGEPGIAGVMVTLIQVVSPTSKRIVYTSVSDANGEFEMLNHKGAGTFYLEYIYPSAGFEVSVFRPAGYPVDITNSANYVSTNLARSEEFSFSTPTDLPNYGLGLKIVANTRTYSVAQPFLETDWNYTAALPQWEQDATPGSPNLLEVSLFFTSGTYHNNIQVENTSTTSSSLYKLRVGADLTLTLPGTLGDVSTITQTTQQSKSLTSFDGIIDYKGNSGMSWFNIGSSNGEGFDFTGSYMSDFIAAAPGGTFDVAAFSTASKSETGGGNILSDIATTAGAGFFVTYVADQPLPLNLISFTGINDASTSLLRWEAVSDGTPGEYFTVEHSVDGRNYTAVGKVNANTEKLTPEQYQFRHLNPANGKNFYRLRLNEVQGDVKTSNVVLVNFTGKNSTAINMYPMPANDVLHVSGVSAEGLALFNMAGQKMSVSSSFNGNQAILHTRELPNGVYMLQVSTADGAIQMEKVLVQH